MIITYEVFCISLISSCLSFFIDYCIGKPSGQFNPGSIFSWYTVWVSKRTLKRYGILEHVLNQRSIAIRTSNQKDHRFRVNRSFNSLIVQNASDLFSYEKMIGMCPVCTNIWISLFIFGFMLLFITLSPFQFISGILLNHLLLRLMIKI